MRKKYAPEHVINRDGVYYYVRHIPYDLSDYYNVNTQYADTLRAGWTSLDKNIRSELQTLLVWQEREVQKL